MGCHQSLKWKNEKCFIVIYVWNECFIDALFTLQTLATCNIWVSGPRKIITASFESPNIRNDTHYLKMGVCDENIWRTLYILLNFETLDYF